MSLGYWLLNVTVMALSTAAILRLQPSVIRLPTSFGRMRKYGVALALTAGALYLVVALTLRSGFTSPICCDNCLSSSP